MRRGVDTWTFRGFAAVMLSPALLYLTVGRLVSDRPAAIESWRTHFYAQHRVFYSLFLATVLTVPLRQFAVLGDAGATLIEGTPAPHLPVLAALLIGVTGIVATSERVHALLIVIMMSTVIVNLARL